MEEATLLVQNRVNYPGAQFLSTPLCTSLSRVTAVQPETDNRTIAMVEAFTRQSYQLLGTTC